jgi:hypothetical protein
MYIWNYIPMNKTTCMKLHTHFLKKVRMICTTYVHTYPGMKKHTQVWNNIPRYETIYPWMKIRNRPLFSTMFTGGCWLNYIKVTTVCGFFWGGGADNHCLNFFSVFWWDSNRGSSVLWRRRWPLNANTMTAGVDFRITIFCNFWQFSAKKLAFYSKTNVIIEIFAYFSFTYFESKTPIFSLNFSAKIF